MDFLKVMNACQPTKLFNEEPLTNAQIESIIQAGQSAPISADLEESFLISAIRSDRARDYFQGRENELPTQTREEIQNGGPVYFIISVKDREQSKESMYLFAGMIMAHMQLQATNVLLGYNFSSEQPNVKILEKPELKNRLGIPQDYTPIQILKVGYTSESVEHRKPHLSEVFTRIIS